MRQPSLALLAVSGFVTLLSASDSVKKNQPPVTATSPRVDQNRAQPVINPYKVRSLQSEAKANLKALFTAEKAFFQEKDRYSTKIGEIGFSPERGNRYRYVLAVYPASYEERSGAYPTRHPATDEGIREDTFKFPAINQTITHGPCAGSRPWGIVSVNPAVMRVSTGPWIFTGAAYANLDGDDALDVWTISTESRMLSGPDCDAVGGAPSGEPINEHDDAKH